MDRPSRKTKVVSYREAKDFDDDDEDFACAKAPPSKKAREDVKREHRKSSSKSSSQDSNSQSTVSQNRRPLDERLRDRDLEAAITLSLLNNSDVVEEQSPTSKGDDVKFLVPTDENTDPSSLHRSNCSVDLAILGLDEITSYKGYPAVSSHRNAAAKVTEEQRKKPSDEDEDYTPKLTPGSETDDDGDDDDDDFSEPADSEDEEFTVNKIGKTKKDKVTKNEKSKAPPASKKEKPPSKPSKSIPQAAAASTPVRSPPTAKAAAPKRPSFSPAVSTPKPAVCLSPAGGRIPKWTPPAQIGRSPTSSQSPAAKSPDEDFACAKAPPSKKAREDVKREHRKSSSKSSSQDSNSQSTVSQNRRPLDERLRDRDLEAAITLSLLNNSDVVEEQSPTSKGDDVKFLVPTDENTDPSSLHRSNCSVDLAILGLDEITSYKGYPAVSSHRNAAAKVTEEQRKKPSDEDEDYTPKLTPGSETDDDGDDDDDDFSEPADSEDEEFTVNKIGKTKKDKVTKNEKSKAPPASKKEKPPSKPSKSIPQAAAASTPVRSPPTAKAAAPKRPSFSPAVSTPKPAVCLSPAGGRIPKWTPPAQIGRSPTSSQSPAAKSPGQGLRLGLSRLVRVKPLHPSLTSH